MKKFVTVIVLFISIIFSCSFVNNNIKVYSDNNYSNVLDDLNKDNNFNLNNYKPNLNATISEMIEVINIAEGENDELFIYTYQPLYNKYNVNATSINLSNDYSVDGSFQTGSIKSYDLELCNSHDALFKYVIKDYLIPQTEYRYYNIISIFRPFIDGVDKPVSGADNVNKAIKIGQQWSVSNINDIYSYEMVTFETVDIKANFIGSLRLNDGFTLGDLNITSTIGQKLDTWIFAFDVSDYIVKKIFDAEMSFTEVQYKDEIMLGISKTYEQERITNNLELTEFDKFKYKGPGLFAKDYTWNRIMSSKDFINNAETQNVDIDPSIKENILSSQWVFSFGESDYKYAGNSNYANKYYSKMEDVSILRLHFQDINNKFYNLACISDKLTSDTTPDGSGEGLDIDFLKQILRYILLIIGIVIVIAILGPFIPMLFSLIVNIIKYVFKFFLWVFKLIVNILLYPFRLLFKLFKKGDNNEIDKR